jgi:hypothetical protein
MGRDDLNRLRSRPLFRRERRPRRTVTALLLLLAAGGLLFAFDSTALSAVKTTLIHLLQGT